jgi:hypothetical protein
MPLLDGNLRAARHRRIPTHFLLMLLLSSISAAPSVASTANPRAGNSGAAAAKPRQLLGVFTLPNITQTTNPFNSALSNDVADFSLIQPPLVGAWCDEHVHGHPSACARIVGEAGEHFRQSLCSHPICTILAGPHSRGLGARGRAPHTVGPGRGAGQLANWR